MFYGSAKVILQLVRFLLIILCLSPLALGGQDTFTGWSGIVLDQSRTAVPGARVTLQQGDVEMTAATDADGRYNFSGLRPGRYRLSLRLHGRHLLYSKLLDFPARGQAEIVVSET